MQPLAGGRCASSGSTPPHAAQLEARRLAHRRHAAAAAAGRRRAGPAAASPSSAFPQIQQVLEETDDEIVGWHWTGSDEFSQLNDRHDAPPLPLPRLERGT